MKKKIIAVISGAVILIIAAGSIYGKPESSHKEGEPDVVGTFSVNRDENLTVNLLWFPVFSHMDTSSIIDILSIDIDWF